MLLKQLIPLILGAGLLLLAVRRLRQYRLKERYTLIFFFIAAPLMALALWPDAVAYVAVKLDIQYSTVALLCVTALFAILILELLSIVSVQDRKITTLAQMVGILMERHQAEQDGRETNTPLPTEEELKAMISGRPTTPSRRTFKPTKPVIMTIADDADRQDPPAGNRPH